MQRKKFLALMLTAALVGQPGAPVSIMAAETDESSDFGSFGSEASDTAEKKLPVITEDLSEETITYDLNEKAEPLKVQTEESGKLKYLWLKSDDNENFYKIGKSDSQEKTKEEQTGEQQGENSQPEYEDTQEYTPVTDTAGTFYYKVRIWNSEETDENAYVESKTVCLQVLDPSAEDHSGLDATDGKKDGEQKDPAALDKEDPAADHTSGDTAENSGNEKDADPDGENSGSEDSGNAADDGKDSGNEAGENTGNEEDNTGESGGENIGGEDPAAEDTDKKDTDIAENDSENHLPKRQEDIPESETYETEGYWNVSLSEIFQDPDGDDLTYYEKGERDEDWTPVDGDSYLCHLEENQETYLFTAKDQEGYGDVYAVTLKKKDAAELEVSEAQKAQEKSAAKDTEKELFSSGDAEAASASNTASFNTIYKETGEHLASMAEKAHL